MARWLIISVLLSDEATDNNTLQMVADLREAINTTGISEMRFCQQDDVQET